MMSSEMKQPKKIPQKKRPQGGKAKDSAFDARARRRRPEAAREEQEAASFRETINSLFDQS